jgi:outer membrane murein-binding lipoprotein Lpp
MFLLGAVVLAGAVVGGAYAVGRYHGKNAVLVKIAAEVDKLEAWGAAEETKLAADLKALLAKLKSAL